MTERGLPWQCGRNTLLLQVECGSSKNLCGLVLTPQDEPTRPAARAEAKSNGYNYFRGAARAYSIVIKYQGHYEPDMCCRS